MLTQKYRNSGVIQAVKATKRSLKTDLSPGKFDTAQESFVEGLAIRARLAEAFPQHTDFNTLKQHFEARFRELS